MLRKVLFLNLLFILNLICGCVGSPVHMTMKYSQVQSIIEKNNEALLNLRLGMVPDQIREIMGKPERSEGYTGGAVWLYRTAMTSGIYGSADSDFTPVVFDLNQKLVGWGRNFYVERVKRYEFNLKKQ